jgi:pyruvate ferredoxin oxidoreductase gamma subunit
MQIHIKIYGLGGQGIVTFGKLLAYAYAIEQGKFSQTIPAYGHERRGAPVNTNLVLSEEPVRSKSFIYKPDYVVVFDNSLIARGINIFEGTCDRTIFFINCAVIPDYIAGYSNTVYCADARRVAIETLKRDIPNTAMAGAFAAAGIITMEAIEGSIKHMFGEEGDGVNVRAAKACYAAVRKQD